MAKYHGTRGYVLVNGQQYAVSGFNVGTGSIGGVHYQKVKRAAVSFDDQTDPALRDADKMLALRALAQLLQKQDELVVVLRPTDPSAPALWIERGEDEESPFVIISVK